MPKLLPFGEYTTAYSVADPAPFEQERVGMFFDIQAHWKLEKSAAKH